MKSVLIFGPGSGAAGIKCISESLEKIAGGGCKNSTPVAFCFPEQEYI